MIEIKTASLESDATSSTKLVSSYRVRWVLTVFTRTFGTCKHGQFLSTTKIEELFEEVKDLEDLLNFY